MLQIALRVLVFRLGFSTMRARGVGRFVNFGQDFDR